MIMPFTMSQIRDIVEISSESLPSLDHVTGLVQDDGAGAITTFSGTTRNVFEGRCVFYMVYFVLLTNGVH